MSEMHINPWKTNQNFLYQYNNQISYVCNSILGNGNQQVFLETAADIIRACENYENIKYSRIFLEKGQKLCSIEKNGWIVYKRDMKKLAYNVALDIVMSVYRKNGC